VEWFPGRGVVFLGGLDRVSPRKGAAFLLR
jgi:hypothetical protein